MRLATTLRFSMVAGAALFVAACGGQGTQSADNSASELDSNLMMDEIGNDASAMESVANTPAPAALPAEDEATPADTGDNAGDSGVADQVDSNVAGM